ncbi:hypothetical protein AB0L86_14970 [Micromonospora musae]
MTASPAPRTRPWHGVLVAATLPHRDDLSGGFDAFTSLHTVALASGGGA